MNEKNKKVVGYAALGMAAIAFYFILQNGSPGSPMPDTVPDGGVSDTAGEQADPYFGNSAGVFQLEPATWASGLSSFRVLEVGQELRGGEPMGGVVTDGYLFPVDTKSGPKHGHGIGNTKSQCGADFFRPLILQFPDDLGRSNVARVEYSVDAPHLNVTPPLSGPESSVDSFFDVFTQISLDGPTGDLSQKVRETYDMDYDGDYILADMPLLEFNCDIAELETQKLTGEVRVDIYNDADELFATGMFPTSTFVFGAGDQDIFNDGFESGDTSAWSSMLP